MSRTKLSEQMGAMALVDQLRLRQRQVQEHLDLPQRRREVADSIRDYYRHQGIDCDDSLIEQGVREFFANRLVFQAPTLSGPRRWLTWLILRREGIFTLLVRTLALGATFYVLSKYD